MLREIDVNGRTAGRTTWKHIASFVDSLISGAKIVILLRFTSRITLSRCSQLWETTFHSKLIALQRRYDL